MSRWFGRVFTRSVSKRPPPSFVIYFLDPIILHECDCWNHEQQHQTNHTFPGARERVKNETAKLIEISLLELSIAQTTCAVCETTEPFPRGLIIDLLILCASSEFNFSCAFMLNASTQPTTLCHDRGEKCWQLYTYFPSIERVSCACVNSIICYQAMKITSNFSWDDHIDESKQLAIKCLWLQAWERETLCADVARQRKLHKFMRHAWPHPTIT